MFLLMGLCSGDTIPSGLLADLAVIQRNASHLSELINDVLDLSQVDAGMMALTKSETNLGNLIEAAILAVKPLFETKGLYIKTDISEDIPLVFCDQTRIREVLLNLISNACRFTDRGGVCIRAWQEGEDVLVSISDTGPGIEAGKMDLLFQPFQQLDGSIRRRHGGTGLGLSISKRFLELHGGSIWAECDMDHGTTFTFRLPLFRQIGRQMMSPDSFRRTLTPDWDFLQRTHPNTAPVVQVLPRVIVLDEGRMLSRILIRYLDGIEIVNAKNLDDAETIAMNDPYQMLIVNDPSMSTALARVKNANIPSHLPVLICSIPGGDKLSSGIGVSDYLVKPIIQEDLLGALEKLNLKGKSILLVDDDPDVLRLFRQMLISSPTGYRVTRARDGEEALVMIGRKKPNAIVMDMVMPNMDGYQFLDLRSRDDTLKQIPVIAVTARDPLGQPIISNALMITRGEGLSVHQLLQFLRMVNEVLSTQGLSGGPALKAEISD